MSGSILRMSIVHLLVHNEHDVGESFFKNSQHANKQVGTVRERKQRKRTVAQGHRKRSTDVVA